MDRPRLLAVFAHPDDETFLAGGTLATYADQGWDVRVACATRGESGKRGPYAAMTQAEFAELRAAELSAACEALGLAPPDFLGCPDGEVTSCMPRAQALVLNVLQTFSPHVVITFGPEGISGHLDHIAVHQLTSEAFREWRAEVLRAPEVDGARAPSRLYYVLRSAAGPTCCGSAGPDPPRLTTTIDIAAAGDRKLAAVRCYRSQAHLHPAGDERRVRLVLESAEGFHRA